MNKINNISIFLIILIILVCQTKGKYIEGGVDVECEKISGLSDCAKNGCVYCNISGVCAQYDPCSHSIRGDCSQPWIFGKKMSCADYTLNKYYMIIVIVFSLIMFVICVFCYYVVGVFRNYLNDKNSNDFPYRKVNFDESRIVYSDVSNKMFDLNE